MFLRKNWKNPRLLFALSLSEFLFAFGNASVGTSSFPWFCDYTIVGWIVTILCFLYLLRLLVTQITILRATIAGLSDRRPIRIGLLLFYIAIAVSFTFFFSGKSLYWMAPVVVAAMWYFTRKNLTDSPAETWRFIGYTGVVFGGLIIFFLQTIGFILLVFLILFLVRGFGESQGASHPVEEQPDHTDGLLERAADGTPFVRHSDGSSTQLRDLGNGDFQDFNGTPWHDSGNGHMFR